MIECSNVLLREGGAEDILEGGREGGREGEGGGGRDGGREGERGE